MRQVIFVRHFQCENQAGHRRPEYRRHASRRAADQHNATVPGFQTEALQLGPQPRTDRAAAINARPFQRRAPAKAYRSDSRNDLREERAEIDVAFVLMIGADDFLGGMLIGIRGQILHDQSRDRKRHRQHRHNRPDMTQEILQQRRP